MSWLGGAVVGSDQRVNHPLVLRVPVGRLAQTQLQTWQDRATNSHQSSHSNRFLIRRNAKWLG